jgi:hypothetical protein
MLSQAALLVIKTQDYRKYLEPSGETARLPRDAKRHKALTIKVQQTESILSVEVARAAHAKPTLLANLEQKMSLGVWVTKL